MPSTSTVLSGFGQICQSGQSACADVVITSVITSVIAMTMTSRCHDISHLRVHAHTRVHTHLSGYVRECSYSTVFQGNSLGNKHSTAQYCPYWPFCAICVCGCCHDDVITSVIAMTDDMTSHITMTTTSHLRVHVCAQIRTALSSTGQYCTVLC